MSALRIDAAGYQTKIIEYCDTEGACRKMAFLACFEYLSPCY